MKIDELLKINECNVCLSNTLGMKRRIMVFNTVINIKKVEEEFGLWCDTCGNLVYGYSKPLE